MELMGAQTFRWFVIFFSLSLYLKTLAYFYKLAFHYINYIKKRYVLFRMDFILYLRVDIIPSFRLYHQGPWKKQIFLTNFEPDLLSANEFNSSSCCIILYQWNAMFQSNFLIKFLIDGLFHDICIVSDNLIV